MGRFINPFTDIGFKRIFGQEFSKPLLIDFLNNLLSGEQVVTEVTFLDKERPSVFQDGRTIIYDIYCQTSSGDHIIVEMQNKLERNFKERTLFYAAEAIVRQGERGNKWQYNVNAVYLVSFINEHKDTFSEDFRTDVMLLDKKHHQVFCDKLHFIYLQLPLFSSEVDDCNTDFDRWIYVLKHMETLTRLPWSAQNAVFKKLEEISELRALTREERLYYDAALREYRDHLYILEGEKEKGREEGRAEGRAEGLAEGEKKAAARIVCHMKKAGKSIDEMVTMTGFSVEEIKNLLKED